MRARLLGSIAAALAAALTASTLASAHESRPAYLEIKEVEPNRYEMLWKVPRRDDLVLPLSIEMPASCSDVAPAGQYMLPGAAVRRRSLRCAGDGLSGQSISIGGLSGTLTDVLVRIEFQDGEVQTLIAKPDDSTFTVAPKQGRFEVARAYTLLGIEHILFGVDHLLFVFCLLLIVDGLKPLVKTVTAFTLAHSVTLGLAALGIVGVPQAPVEAVIALSILFLARELVVECEGSTSLTRRLPWIVALCFGLLHGFGFAGALREVGLPQHAIPLALFSFNVGVEIGQLAFIAVMSAALWLLRRFAIGPPAWTRPLGYYAIGTVAGFWFVGRLAAF